MSHIYPTEDKLPFYVEFERGDRDREFTIFRRQFMYSEEELAVMKEEAGCTDDFTMLVMTNEVHPWNIFTAGYRSDGCVPDRKWIEWMVDALNEKTQKELDVQSKS